MNHNAYTRLRDAYLGSADSVRKTLAKRFPHEDPDELATPDGIRERAETLSPRERKFLRALLEEKAADLDEIAIAEPKSRPLAAAGLVFPFERDEYQYVAIPFEVRLALADLADPTTLPVGVLLARRDVEDLLDLATILGLDEEVETLVSAMDLAIAIALELCDVESVHDLFESLPTAAKRLAHRFCELPEPIPLEKGVQIARHFSELAGDAASTAEKILLRFGLIHQLTVEGDALLVMPYDVRSALSPTVEDAVIELCRIHYEALVGSGIPAPRDIFPHGAGGDPLRTARRILVGSEPRLPETPSPLATLLDMFRVTEKLDGRMENASIFLDAPSPEAFAQQMLRMWLMSLDDPFTRLLIDATGGDPEAMAAWVLEAEREGNPRARDWIAFLFLLRGTLLFTLGTLGPGVWYAHTDLADYFAATYRLLLFDGHGLTLLRDTAPEHAIPLLGADITTDDGLILEDVLHGLLEELLEPIGAVRLDRAGTRFMTNPEALRIFRDGEPFFDVLWEIAERTLVNDVELWLPFPTHWGARVAAPPDFAWVTEQTLALPDDCHVHDLLRVSEWATPWPGAERTLFRFDTRHDDADVAAAAGFLAWLTVRTNTPIPDEVASLFPRDAVPTSHLAAVATVTPAIDALLDEMRSWEKHVPRRLMEDLRAYGAIANRQVLDALEAALKRADADDPMVIHLSLLLGEIGGESEVSTLARALAHTRDELLEAAAGSALARIGPPAADMLLSMLLNPATDVDKRLACAGALSAMAVMHADLSLTVAGAIMSACDAAEDLPEDVPTLLAIMLAETGAPQAEILIDQLVAQGFWLEDYMPHEEALWIASIAPAIWGHPLFGAPLALLYPDTPTATRLRDAANAPTPKKRRRRRKAPESD